VGVLLFSVAATIVIARTLGPSGRGAIAVAFSFTLLMVQFGILGLHSANSYFAARDPAQIARILTNTLWASALMGTVLALLGVTLNELFPSILRGLDALEITLVLLGVPAALASNLLQSILLAEGRMIAYNGVELGMAITVFVGLTVGLTVFSFGVLGAIALLVTVNLAGSIAYFVLLSNHRPLPHAPDLRLLRAMLHYGTRIYLAGLMAYVILRANLLLVNIFLGVADAGQFSVAVGLMEAICLLPTVVALNLFPRVARGDGSTDTAAVFRSLTLVYGGLCIATIPVAGIAIRLLYGNAFSPAVPVYYVMLPAIFSYGMVSVLSFHFAGRGFPLGALLVWFVGVALNFAIAIPLLAEGANVETAALAMSVAYTVILVLHVRLFAAETGSYRALAPRPRETLRLIGETLETMRRGRRPRAA
jgi:O-antigen/teichoic acid export membrane protein